MRATVRGRSASPTPAWPPPPARSPPALPPSLRATASSPRPRSSRPSRPPAWLPERLCPPARPPRPRSLRPGPLLAVGPAAAGYALLARRASLRRGTAPGAPARSSLFGPRGPPKAQRSGPAELIGSFPRDEGRWGEPESPPPRPTGGSRAETRPLLPGGSPRPDGVN